MNVVLLIFAVVLIHASSQEVEGNKNVVCYFASWTVYRPGNGKFDVENIDPTLCTHINFGFVGINEDGTLRIIDPWESNDEGLHGFRRLVALKNPKTKVMVSMGGWNEGAAKFSSVANDPALRSNLISSVISFIEKYNFDGFDLDWEYPGSREGSNPERDPENYVTLLKELKAALQPRGYLLSAAVAGGVERIDIGYRVKEVSSLLDMINVMTYDFHGYFDNYVGHGAPLYKSHYDIGPINETLNVAAGIEHWLELGADPSKLNMGVVTYGRSFTLTDPNNRQPYSSITGGGHPGPYMRQAGFLGYNEICELYPDWTYEWYDEMKVPFRYKDDQLVGYDDVRSMKEKVLYANSKKLGGIMIWSLDTDDFRGLCGEAYPLLKTIHENLK
nr:unnamed protein product [Callosobruchus chinensis]